MSDMKRPRGCGMRLRSSSHRCRKITVEICMGGMGKYSGRSMELDKLHNKDCIAGMNELAEGSVDLAFADPPFNIGYKYDVYEDKLAADKYLDWTHKWGKALVRTLKPTGTFWLAIGDDFAAELKLIFQRELGLCCRSWVIWYYT